MLVAMLHSSCGLNTLVYGPGSLELRLITAKLAARDGGNAALYAGPDAKAQQRWRSLMYGKESADADAPGCARVMTTADELGACLAAVEALVLVCDSAPLEESALSALFSNAGDDFRRVVLVSKMGVTRAKPAGPFGIGGGDAALAASEASLRKATSARGVDMSTIRVGTLKGGGPGSGTVELGLSKLYYDGIVDLTAFMTTQSYDKFTNGAKVLRGDPCILSNPLLRAGRASSFDPFEDETSRHVAAAAAVHALTHPSAIELTVSAASGEEPPTKAEWAELFNRL